MIKSSDLIRVVTSKIGAPYWFGTFGQTASAALLEAKTKQYPSHYTADRMARYKSQFGKQVFDCSGLIKYVLMTEAEQHALIYLPALDYSTESIFNKATQKGPIKNIPDIPGLGLYKSGHVGVYLGNDSLIEAKGFNYGVVQSKLSQRDFTHYFFIPDIDYNNTTTQDLHAIAQQLRQIADSIDK